LSPNDPGNGAGFFLFGSGTLVATSSGRSAGLAFGIPVLFIAGTEASACEALAADADPLARRPGGSRDVQETV